MGARKKDEGVETPSFGKRNIYFNKDNLDIYNYLNGLGHKGSKFACLAIRRLIEESIDESELDEIESPSNDMLMLRIKRLEERIIKKENEIKKEIIETIQSTLYEELGLIKELVLEVQFKLKDGVVIGGNYTQSPASTVLEADDVADFVDNSEISEDAVDVLFF